MNYIFASENEEKGYFLLNLREKFQVSQNTSEASLFGYSGPSRINTLQREQDMKIDTIAYLFFFSLASAEGIFSMQLGQ